MMMMMMTTVADVAERLRGGWGSRKHRTSIISVNLHCHFRSWVCPIFPPKMRKLRHISHAKERELFI